MEANQCAINAQFSLLFCYGCRPGILQVTSQALPHDGHGFTELEKIALLQLFYFSKSILICPVFSYFALPLMIHILKKQHCSKCVCCVDSIYSLILAVFLKGCQKQKQIFFLYVPSSGKKLCFAFCQVCFMVVMVMP